MAHSQAAPTGAPTHSDEVHASYQRILEKSTATSRYVDIGFGQKAYVLEAGDGPPVVFLHGGNTNSLSDLIVLERLQGVRGIAIDRPGFGLSDPVDLSRDRFRETAVEFVDSVFDALALTDATLAASSGGGVWALWYALAHPERVRRLALLCSAPLLPGTHVPMPLRMMATPLLGNVMQKAIKPTPRMLVRLMTTMGEGNTIVNYPDLIESLVAAAKDPVAIRANNDELRAYVSPFGFRPAVRFQPEDLRQLSMPTLLIWGDRDPIGEVSVAKEIAHTIPNAQLEILPGGHVPYLGNPDRTAELLSVFAR